MRNGKGILYDNKDNIIYDCDFVKDKINTKEMEYII